MTTETQEAVGRWIDTTFPGTDPLSPRKAIRALEEMVELCLASGAGDQEIAAAVGKALASAGNQPIGRQPEKIPAEAADVLIVLYGVAYVLGFDLHVEVGKKMVINRTRKWKANGDGTGYHVKGESRA